MEDEKQPCKIGIIGYGRFGRLVAEKLSPGHPILIHDPQQENQTPPGCLFTDLSEVCALDILIICVPISAFASTITKIIPLLHERCLVVDVCSVKEYSYHLLEKLLPAKISFLSTHPLFGPDSAIDGIRGKKIVLCGGRIASDRYRVIRARIEEMGLSVIETSPEEHDRQIAHSQVLTHFIGRALLELGVAEMPVSTDGYIRLLHILGVVANDSRELFIDMNIYNRYAKPVRAELIKCLTKIDLFIATTKSPLVPSNTPE